MTAALAEQRLSCKQEYHKNHQIATAPPSRVGLFFLPELFNLPVLDISNWASIQTFFDFTSEY